MGNRRYFQLKTVQLSYHFGFGVAIVFVNNDEFFTDFFGVFTLLQQ